MLRVNLTEELCEVMLSTRFSFSKRSWPFLVASAVPWLVCAGQRSVTRIWAMANHARSRSAYYRFLSEGKWRMDLFFRGLFELIVRVFNIQELTLVLDDTLCPKWGKKIFGTATHYDHTSRPRAGFIWGHNWIVLSVVVPIGNCAVALPFWIRLYRSKESTSESEFQTRHQLAAEALALVRTWFSGPIRLLADGAYGNRSLIKPARELGVRVVSRLRSDARLRSPIPPRRKTGQRGRVAKKGSYLPSLTKIGGKVANFQSMQVHIYGRDVRLLVHEFVAWWEPLGAVIKVVITRDPNNTKRRAYLFSTNPEEGAKDVIEGFAMRWSIEQMFSVAKNQLGLDSAEVRKEKSVLRHAALCMALVTWTEVWAYKKASVKGKTFHSKLAALREDVVTESIFAASHRAEGSRRNANQIGKLFSAATDVA